MSDSTAVTAQQHPKRIAGACRPCASIASPNLHPFITPTSQRAAGWLQVYRLRRWQQKMANARLLLYAALGYAVAGYWDPPLTILLNTAALAGLIMFQGVFNDYWDFRLSREDNALGSWIRTGRLTSRSAIAWVMVPLVLTISAGWWLAIRGASSVCIGLLLLGALIAVGYSLPPLRLKVRRPWGVCVAPLLTTLMFLEAHRALAPLSAIAWLLASLLLIFQLYAELVQVVAESPTSASKFPPSKALSLIRWLPGLSAMLAVPYSILHPVFWFGVVGGLLRWTSIQRQDVGIRTALRQGRVHLFHPIFSSYEFLGYALWGVWHGLQRV